MNNIKPTYFLEVWRCELGRICWAQRWFTTVRSFNNYYAHNEHFYGMSATVHTATDDHNISREELLEVAINHVKGNCITIVFDLKKCTVNKIYGRPSTPDY